MKSLNNLAVVRKSLGITQSELGARIDLSGASIGLIEAGLRVSDDRAAAIAAALGVDVAVLSATKLRIDVTSPAGTVTVSCG